jgi:hypothetical protein
MSRLGEQLAERGEQRGVDQARAERVDLDAVAGEERGAAHA